LIPRHVAGGIANEKPMTVMAHYDTPGLTYDSGVLYEEPDPSPTPRKHMSKIKLNLGSLNVEQKITLGNNIKTAMTANAVFPTPNPTLPNYGTAVTSLTTKNAAVVALQSQLGTALSDRDAAELNFDVLTRQLASYVDNIAVGDPVKIQSAGMDVKATPAPIGVPNMPSNLSLTASDADGQLDVHWDRVRGAKSYEIQTSPDPITLTSWQNRSSVTKSAAILAGLTSGTKVWVHIRAIGASGPGAWSDPATKVVP
jgi:hypothetical protein